MKNTHMFTKLLAIVVAFLYVNILINMFTVKEKIIDGRLIPYQTYFKQILDKHNIIPIAEVNRASIVKGLQLKTGAIAICLYPIYPFIKDRFIEVDEDFYNANKNTNTLKWTMMHENVHCQLGYHGHDDSGEFNLMNSSIDIDVDFSDISDEWFEEQILLFASYMKK
jgi:hypothetical protein